MAFKLFNTDAKQRPKFIFDIGLELEKKNSCLRNKVLYTFEGLYFQNYASDFHTVFTEERSDHLHKIECNWIALIWGPAPGR